MRISQDSAKCEGRYRKEPTLSASRCLWATRDNHPRSLRSRRKTVAPRASVGKAAPRYNSPRSGRKNRVLSVTGMLRQSFRPRFLLCPFVNRATPEFPASRVFHHVASILVLGATEAAEFPDPQVLWNSPWPELPARPSLPKALEANAVTPLVRVRLTCHSQIRPLLSLVRRRFFTNYRAILWRRSLGNRVSLGNR